MSYKVGNRIKFLDNPLVPEVVNLIGVIVTKMRSPYDGEFEYYVEIEGLRTFHFSEWYLKNYSKPIKFYHYAI